MKLILFSYFNILIILTSCNGRTKENALNSENVNKNISLGDTVNKLGKQLWYVFQDKQNNYWFSSNGEGVYRYDGKTIVNFTTKMDFLTIRLGKFKKTNLEISISQPLEVSINLMERKSTLCKL
ncbi:MAG: hypothetical protein IPJ43_01675 [Saprospiraceae bacterium]|nr:hypothetical protein [Saprospiraceae bacterium]